MCCLLVTISKLKSASLCQFETSPSPQASPAGRGSFEIVSKYDELRGYVTDGGDSSLAPNEHETHGVEH